MSLEQFREALIECRVLSADELAQFDQSLPAEKRPGDARSLARLLVEHRLLTKYQAAHVYQNNPLPLVLGNYVIQGKIGAGGMGRVYKAHHRRLDRLAAIKLLPRDMMDSPEAVARFQQEVKAAARLSHPNVVITYDADEQDGIHFLVMEYVPGSDLANIVKQEGPLPVDLAVECILQTAEGLAYAHERGVIHRDVKPSNLLLVRSGRNSPGAGAAESDHFEAAIKILDLGLARLSTAGSTRERADGERLTNTGQIIGSVDYMSPEQATDTRAADERSDVYGLGCTFYVLLVGKIPYYAKSLMKRLAAHREKTIPDVRDLRPEVPALLAELCQRMMAKNPSDRPQSMREVITLLHGCAGGAPAEEFAASDSGVSPEEILSPSSEALANPPPRKRTAPPIAAPPISAKPSTRLAATVESQAADEPEFQSGNTLVSNIADPTASPPPRRHRSPQAPPRRTWIITVVVSAMAAILLVGTIVAGCVLYFWN